MRIFALVCFAVMCLAQWIVPGKMIYDSERTITTGTPYKFETQPVDPSDPFRGKYITLSFKENSVLDTGHWQSGEIVNITFITDSAGYAKAESISRETPATGPYLQTKVFYTESGPPPTVHFTLPFDRLYLEESKASDAEQQYWQSQRDSTKTTYAVVKIGSGTAVLTDVMINDKSIIDIVDEMNKPE